MNKSRELEDIFRKYMSKKNVESTRPYVYPGNNVGGQRSSSFQEGSNCVIYFFEWSDPHREPKRFLSLDDFKSFLKDCCIYLNTYESCRISNWKLVYVICKKGSKDLIISPTYQQLLNDIIIEDNGRKVNEPYNVQCTRPPMYNH